MNKTFHYKCKFCGKAGTVQGDEAGLAFIGDINKWLAMIACARCAHFMERKRKVTDRMTVVCRKLETTKENDKDRQTVEAEAKMNLENLTKKYCTLVNDYYRQANVWDQTLAQKIFHNPNEASTIISEYLRRVDAESTKQIVTKVFNQMEL